MHNDQEEVDIPEERLEIEENDRNQSDEEEERRSQPRVRPMERLTYDSLGQPSYRRWNVEVNSLLPSPPITMFPNALPITYNLL